MPDNQEPIHKFTGTYTMSGTITADDGQMYSFKCCRVRRDSTGPKVHGMVPCTLNILVNSKAFQQMTMVVADNDDDEPAAEPEQSPVTDENIPSGGRKRHTAAVG